MNFEVLVLERRQDVVRLKSLWHAMLDILNNVYRVDEVHDDRWLECASCWEFDC